MKPKYFHQRLLIINFSFRFRVIDRVRVVNRVRVINMVRVINRVWVISFPSASSHGLSALERGYISAGV